MGVRGFIDIHCHVVPGLDDGPATLAASTELAREALRWGTLAVVATPHRSLRYNWSRHSLRNALQRLESHLPEGVALFAGCELELSDEAWRCFEASPRYYSLNSSRYVLLELPQTGIWRSFATILDKLRTKGFVPIVAHAERCRPLARRVEQLTGWVRHGCLLQITADAICGRRGPSARSAAMELLRAGLAHFVASDAHDATRRGPNLQPAYRAVTELLGVEHAARLFTYNPLCVLRDEPLEG
jgi:protein-tyrosine phosphatase